MGFKVGEKVVMNDKYVVHDKYKGVVFTIRHENTMIGNTELAWLDGYSGGYAADGLTKVENNKNDKI